MDKVSLAHEIINPLNVIVGYAELTKSEKDKSIIMENLDHIIKESVWCSTLLKEELEMYTLRTTDYNFYEILSESIDNIKKFPLYIQKNLKLQIDESKLKRFKKRFKIDKPIFIKIILNNILKNAIKYSKNGSVIKIILNLNNDNNKLNISIQNEYQTTQLLKNKFMESHNIGLEVIDQLVKKIDGDWDFLQLNNKVIVMVNIPVNYIHRFGFI
jgi:signal transduction histidine kinase